MKPTISKPFKSNDRTFDKVYNAFDKRDYFNSQGLAKVQIGNFERALQKNDKGAQQVLDLFKGDEQKAKDYITQVVSDRNKERAFNNYKALKSAVDSIQKGKPNVGAVDYVKRIIHNSSQKYSIALYSTLRNKKFTKWKDVHNDIDSLIGESVNEIDTKKANLLRTNMPGYVGPKFAKKASDEDILAMADLKDQKARIYNRYVKVVDDAIAKLQKKYRIKESVNEGKKRYYQQDRVGSAKYTISYHDGKKKHKDGSDFFDIQTFKNKKDLAKFVNTLHKGGYVYGFNESVNEGISVFDERHFGKKGIIIMIDDNGKKVSAIFKDKKNADKFNRNKPSDIKKLLQLAKKTKFPKAIDESLNEAKEPEVISQLRDIVKRKQNKKIKDPISGKMMRVDLYSASAITKVYDAINKSNKDKFGKLSLPKMVNVAFSVIKKESVNEAYIVLYSPKKGVKPVTTAAYKDKKDAEKWAKDLGGITMIVKKKVKGIDENKTQINKIKKQAGKKEIKFYDILSNLEKKLGKKKYRDFLVKSLKDFKINGNHYDYRTNAAAEEKLFQIS